MFLASLARAIVSHPELVAARKAKAAAKREAADGRGGRVSIRRHYVEPRERAPRAPRLPPPDTRMIEFHARIDGLRLAPSLTEAFKSLSGNEQRLFANAAGEALCAAIPVYLAIEPEKRRAGLDYAKQGKREPFLDRLSDYLKQSRRTLADDDADLI